MTRHVLRHRDFGLFLGGRFASVLAAQMQWVANGWYLYDLTGDPMTLGWAGLASFIPIALLTLPAGDLADRMDRRWLLAVAHFENVCFRVDSNGDISGWACAFARTWSLRSWLIFHFVSRLRANFAAGLNVFY